MAETVDAFLKWVDDKVQQARLQTPGAPPGITFPNVHNLRRLPQRRASILETLQKHLEEVPLLQGIITSIPEYDSGRKDNAWTRFVERELKPIQEILHDRECASFHVFQRVGVLPIFAATTSRWRKPFHEYSPRGTLCT